jgi:hypothetical protein
MGLLPVPTVHHHQHTIDIDFFLLIEIYLTELQIKGKLSNYPETYPRSDPKMAHNAGVCAVAKGSPKSRRQWHIHKIMRRFYYHHTRTSRQS